MDALFHDRVQLGAADDAQLHVITGVPDQDRRSHSGHPDSLVGRASHTSRLTQAKRHCFASL